MLPVVHITTTLTTRSTIPSVGARAGAGAVPARPADLARGAAAARAPGRQVARDARQPPEAAAHHDDNAAGAGACAAAPASDDLRQARLEVGLEQEGPPAARAPAGGLLVLTLFHCSPPLDDLHDDELQRRDLLAAAVGLRLVLQLVHLGQQPHDDVADLADAADGRAQHDLVFHLPAEAPEQQQVRYGIRVFNGGIRPSDMISYAH